MEPPPAIGEGADNGTATALSLLIFNAQQGPPQGFRWKAPANQYQRRILAGDMMAEPRQRLRAAVALDAAVARADQAQPAPTPIA